MAEDVEDKVAAQTKSHWFIDLDWYQQSNRSFLTLAQHCLCSKCKERLKEGEISPEDLFSAVKDCCSQAEGFISDGLPVMEGIFRLFLANGNQPLDLEELGEKLRELRGEGVYPTSPAVLSRILESDCYYGLRLVQE
jgi:hypothetical protein